MKRIKGEAGMAVGRYYRQPGEKCFGRHERSESAYVLKVELKGFV